MKKTCSNFPSSHFGFTLIELLVTIGVIGLLFTIGIASYQEFNRKQMVVQSAKELKENLRLAQNKSLSGEKPSGCTGTLAGWQVNIPDLAASYQIQAVCPNVVNFRTINLPGNITKATGPDNVFFKVLGRGVDGVDSSGTITISGFGTIVAQVTVTSAGEIRIGP